MPSWQCRITADKKVRHKKRGWNKGTLGKVTNSRCQSAAYGHKYAGGVFEIRIQGKPHVRDHGERHFRIKCAPT